MPQWQNIQKYAIFEIQLVALFWIGKTFCCFLTEGNPGGHAAVRWRVIHVQAGPAYIPTIGPPNQPTNRPTDPPSRMRQICQAPTSHTLHSFPLTRNSGTHKQVSPSPIPLSLWLQNSNWFIEYVAFVNDYWGSSSLHMGPEAWVSRSAIYKDG